MLTNKDLQNLLPEFISYLSNNNSSRSTIKNYASDLRRVLDKLPINLEIDDNQISSAFETLKTEFSESTIRRFTFSFKSFRTWLTSKGYNLNPVVFPKATLSDNIKLSPIETYVEHIKTEGAQEKTIKDYRADLNSFFSWLKPNSGSLNQKVINKVNRFDINRYTSFLRSKHLSQGTINRYLYSLKGFFNFHKEDIIYETNPVNVTRTVLPSGRQGLVTEGNFFSRFKLKKPRFWHAYRGHPISDYINYAALAAITLLIGVGLFQQLFPQKPIDITNLRTEIQKGLVLAATPPRILSFQGRLTNASGTPVTGATNVVFRIWDHVTNATEVACDAGGDENCMWKSKTWSVTPDSNGIFSVQLGDTGQSDTTIPASLFSDNAALYLGVTIGADAEATPRQRIASATYALNSDSLDGIDSLSFLRSDTTDNFTSGTLTFDSGTTLTGADGSTFTVNSTTIGIGNATGDTITINGTPTFTTDTNFTLAATENVAMTSDLAGTVDVISIIGTPSSTSGTTQGLFIQQAASANTNGLDVGIKIDNADTDLLLSDAISITNTGAFGNVYINFLNTPSIDITGAGAITGATGLTSSGTITFSSLITDANAVLYTTTGGVVTRVVETETGSQCLLSGAGASGIPVWGSCTTASTSPFVSDGTTITKVTIGDVLSLRYGDAGDTQLTIENTTNNVIPTADGAVIDLTGNTTGIVTNGVDGLFISTEFGNGTTNTNSGLHIDVNPVNSPSGDEIFYGINIDGISTSSATETAINIGTGWDTAINSTLATGGQAVSIDALTNPNTLSSATSGIVDLNVSSATDLNTGVNIDYTSTNSGGVNQLYAARINLTKATSAVGGLTGLYVNNTTATASAGGTTHLIKVENLNTSNAVTNGVLVLSAAGTITNGFNASGSSITNALSIGANKILGTTGAIDFTNFDVSNGGAISVNAGGDITGLLLNLSSCSTCSSNNIAVATGNKSGDITYIYYPSAAAINSPLQGINLDLYSGGNVTATGEEVTGINVSLPGDTNIAGSTKTGLSISAGAGITQNTAAAGTFNGVLVTTPALTFTSGTSLTANGLNIAVGSAGTGSTLYGVNIGNASGASTTKYAVSVGTGWNIGIQLPLATLAAINLSDAGGTAPGGIRFNTGDVQLFRSAPNTLSLGATTTVTATGALAITGGTSLALNSAAANNIALNPGTTGDIVFTHGDASQFAINATPTADTSQDSVKITLNPTITGSTNTLQGLVISQSDNANTGVYDSLLKLENLKTPETTTNGLFIQHNAASGTLSNGIQLTNTAGTFTTGLNFTGTFTNLISAPNFSVTNAGLITGVGVTSGSGLIQGTGGLTITGTTSINASGSTDTSIGTGSNSGTITIGNASSTNIKLGKFTGENAIIYTADGTSDGTLAALTNGSTGDCLKATTGSAPSWAACGGGSQTPWTSDIDADGFDLNDLSNILFRETAGAPTSTDVSLFRDNAGDLNLNALSTKSFNVQVAGADEYNFSSTGLEFNSNNITGLGTTLTATAGLSIATTTTGVLTLDSGTTGAVNLGNGANAKTITIGNATSTTTVTIDTGTGGLNLSNNNVAKTISIGNGTNADTINIGTGGSSAAETITIGSTDTDTSLILNSGGTGGLIDFPEFDVNTDGDVLSAFTQLNGTTTTSSGKTSSTSLDVTSGTNFDIGNYVRVDRISGNCSGSVDPCYAKITAKPSANNLTISPALSWDSGAAVDEFHIPEIGGNDVASPTLTNRYGRGYFIAGTTTGNGSTTFGDLNIQFLNAETFTFTDDAENLLVSIADGGTVGNVTITGTLNVTGAITGSASDLTCTNCIGATEIDESTISGANLSDGANIAHINAAETITGGWLFNTAATTFTTGIVANGSISSAAATAISLTTGTTGILTLDSGSTGNVNLGTGNNAKTVNIGTGTAGNTINIGTDNTTLDTINIGSALDNVAITGDQWSVTNAGVLTVVSCSGCGGGGFSGEIDDTTNDSLTFTTADGSPPSATRSIYASGTNDLIINVKNGGVLNLQENDATEFSFSDTTLDFNANTITDVGDITATAGLTINTSSNGNLTLAPNGGGDIVFTTDTDTNIQASAQITGTNALDLLSLTLDNRSSSGIQRGLVITHSDNAGFTATESLLSLVDVNSQSTAINDALIITSGLNNNITDAIDVSDAELTNAINVGQNTVLANGSFSIDLVNGSNDSLTITNTGAGIASVSLGEAGSYTGAGAVILSSGGSSGLTLDSASGRVTVATGDFLSLGVSGVSGAAAGDIWYDTAAGKFKINETTGGTKILCNITDGGCGGGGSTLASAYTAGSAGDQTITLSTANDSIIVSNPTSGGTDSLFTFKVSQNNTTANVSALDVVQFSNAANGITLNTNSIQTATSLQIVANALTSGKGITVSSSSTAFTGSLTEIVLSGSNAANTGNLLKLSNTGTANTNTSLYVNHEATGTGNLALRIDDVSGDTTPFIVDGGGRVGIGTIAITGPTERLLQIGSPTNRGNSATYGEVITKGQKDITALTNIKDTFIYDTTADSDGGRWIDWSTTEKLSWYTEALDDGFDDPCVIASDDRCYTQNFPRKALLVVTDNALYIFDATTNVMWMKFSQNSGGYALGIDTNNTPSSVTALNGVIYVGTNGTAAGGLYVFDFTQDRMWNYDATDRSAADLGISSRNSAISYASDNNTNFDLGTVGTVADWAVINDVSVASIKQSSSAITTTQSGGNGAIIVALATDSGLTTINLSTQKIRQYSDTANEDYSSVVITSGAILYGLNETADQAEKWLTVDNDNIATQVAGNPTKLWDEASAPALSKSAPAMLADAPDALEVVERGSLADGGVVSVAGTVGSSDLLYVGTNQGMTEIHDHTLAPTKGWSKFYTTTEQTAMMIGTTTRMHMLNETSGDLTNSAETDVLIAKNAPTYGVPGVRGTALSFNGTDEYLCSGSGTTCANDASDDINTGSFYFSVWFKHSVNLPSGTPDTLFARCYNTTPTAATGCIAAAMTTTGTMSVTVDDDALWTIGATTNNDVWYNTAKLFNDNQWHNLSLSKINGATAPVFIIDGQVQSYATSLTHATMISAQIIGVGTDCSGGAACAGGNLWEGAIDDFQVSTCVSAACTTDGFSTTSALAAPLQKRLYNDARPLLSKRYFNGAADTVSYSSTVITDSSSPAWIPNELAGTIVTITSGGGIGQTRRIVSNTASAITVSPAFSTTPASNDDFEVDPEALMGTTNSVTAIGITSESPIGESRQMCVGTNNGADAGAVTCYNHNAGPNIVVNTYHGDSEELDDSGAEWTGGDYDDIQSIDISGSTMIVGSMAHIWTETQDVRLGQAVDYISNKLYDVKNALLNLGTTTLPGTPGLEIGLVGGADLAEYYYSDIGLEAGTLVTFDPEKQGDNISTTTEAYQNSMLGIISTEPGATLGENKPGSSHPVALAGRVPARVTTNDGKDPIKAGDYLTASNIPGVAMKAKKAGFVIGMALEDFPPRPVLGVNNEANGQGSSSENPVATGSAAPQGIEDQPKVSDEPTEDGQVLVFVNRTWYVPTPEEILENTTPTTVTLDANSNWVAPLSAGAKFIWKNSAGQVVAFVSDTGEAMFNKITALVGDFGKLVFGEAVVKKEAKTAGEATFAADATEVFIESDKVTEESLINLTASTKTNGLSLYIKEKKVGEGFVVALERNSGDQPNQATASATTAIKFTWFLLNQQ